jgi:hypothetical protein
MFNRKEEMAICVRTFPLRCVRLAAKLHTFLVLVLDGDWSALCSSHLNPQEKSPLYLSERRLGQPRYQPGCCYKEKSYPSHQKSLSSLKSYVSAQNLFNYSWIQCTLIFCAYCLVCSISMHLFKCVCNSGVSYFTLWICMELLNHFMHFCEIWCLN